MNGYLPVGRFYRLLPDCGPKKRETEGYDYQFDTFDKPTISSLTTPGG